MKSIKRKRKFIFKKKFFAIVFCAVAVYCCVAFVFQQVELSKINEERKAIQLQIASQKLKMQELEYLLRYSDTYEYIEKIAREKLGWVRQGETKYVEKNK